MRHAVVAESSDPSWPRWWRMFVVGSCTLILCSCRGAGEQAGYGPGAYPQTAAGLPPEAYAGVPPAAMASDPAALGSAAFVPGAPVGPWAPPGIRRPWPHDEYLQDGGDRGAVAAVGDQRRVIGLETEDTIAHYDTLDGRTVVEPSNRVHIYSPRFGAVRHVVSLESHEQVKVTDNVGQPIGPAGPTSLQVVDTHKQHVQTERQIGAKLAGVYRSRQGDGRLSTARRLHLLQDDTLLPFENLQIIRQGTFEAAEMPFLARGTAAAVAWEHTAAVEVILGRQAAMNVSRNENLEFVFAVEEPPANPRLRLVKLASTQFARPGDEVAFTLRFDNVGNQAIGNVTIIDNLTTRLEYVPDSAECTLGAGFSTQANEGESLVIRCEIADPIEPGQGGVIRFRCRVR